VPDTLPRAIERVKRRGRGRRGQPARDEASLTGWGSPRLGEGLAVYGRLTQGNEWWRVTWLTRSHEWNESMIHLGNPG
jgi:hypothetical protein